MFYITLSIVYHTFQLNGINGCVVVEVVTWIGEFLCIITPVIVDLFGLFACFCRFLIVEESFYLCCCLYF